MLLEKVNLAHGRLLVGYWSDDTEQITAKVR